jgi:hypothetical protein
VRPHEASDPATRPAHRRQHRQAAGTIAMRSRVRWNHPDRNPLKAQPNAAPRVSKRRGGAGAVAAANDIADRRVTTVPGGGGTGRSASKGFLPRRVRIASHSSLLLLLHSVGRVFSPTSLSVSSAGGKVHHVTAATPPTQSTETIIHSRNKPRAIRTAIKDLHRQGQQRPGARLRLSRQIPR